MNLRPPMKSRRNRKVRGRGPGTGLGTTCGRGNNGQKSRSGYSRKIGFEGGQMPLVRRLPKRGFNNTRFEKNYQVLRVSDLESFKDGDVVDYKVLLDRRLVNRKNGFVKLIGGGELKKKLHIKVNGISAGAREAVEKSGGTVDLLKG